MSQVLEEPVGIEPTVEVLQASVPVTDVQDIASGVADIYADGERSETQDLGGERPRSVPKRGANGRPFQGGVSDLHHQLVDAVVASEGASSGQFTATVLRAVLGKYGTDQRMCRCGECDSCDGRQQIRDSFVVPDAFRIDAEGRAVTVYEVEVTSSISDEKFRRLFNWMWLLDQHEWSLWLVVIDRHGARSEVDLFARWADSRAA